MIVENEYEKLINLLNLRKYHSLYQYHTQIRMFYSAIYTFKNRNFFLRLRNNLMIGMVSEFINLFLIIK